MTTTNGNVNGNGDKLIPRHDVKVMQLMHIMDAVDDARRRSEAVQKQLNRDELRAEIKKTLTATYAAMGQTEVDDTQVDEAIDNYFSKLYKFETPEENWKTRLAESYVDGKVRKYAITTGVVTGLALGTWGVASGVQSAMAGAKESDVEERFEKEYKHEKELESGLKELSSSPERSSLPQSEVQLLDGIVSVSREKLGSVGVVLEKYCDDGIADDDITKGNMDEARVALETKVIPELNSVDSQVKKGLTVLGEQKDLVGVRRSLDTLIGEVRSLNSVPQSLNQKAESEYKAGITSLDNRQLGQAKEHQNNLGSVKREIQDFVTLPQDLERVYNSINTIAQEAEAKTKATTLYNQGKQHVQGVNVPMLKGTIGELRDMESELNKEYRLIITGGTERDGKSHYLLIQCLDSKGNPVKMKIRNEENGQVKEVSKWAERVPRSVYDQVGADYAPDNKVDNDLFAQKRKGYLTLEKSNIGKQATGGQITDW